MRVVVFEFDALARPDAALCAGTEHRLLLGSQVLDLSLLCQGELGAEIHVEEARV